VFTFTACFGDNIPLRLEDLTGTSQFTPWLRLYGPNGALLNSAVSAAAAQFTRQAPANDTYLVVVADGAANIGGAGTYRLTGSGFDAGVRICLSHLGTKAFVGGAGAQPREGYVMVTATNITTPAPLWKPILTNNFGPSGAFTFTNLFPLTLPQQFFRLELR